MLKAFFYLITSFLIIISFSCKTVEIEEPVVIIEEIYLPEAEIISFSATHPGPQILYFSDMLNGPQYKGQCFLTYDSSRKIFTAAGLPDVSFRNEYITTAAGVFTGSDGAGISLTGSRLAAAKKNGKVSVYEYAGSDNWNKISGFTAETGLDSVFSASAADSEFIYLYSGTENRIYLYSRSGRLQRIMEFIHKDISSGMSISFPVIDIDIKSGYMYILDSQGLLHLADLEKLSIEISYALSSFQDINSSFAIRQEEDLTDIILAGTSRGKENIIRYSLIPLSEQYKMAHAEGFIKITRTLRDNIYVLTDRNGNILYQLQSRNVNLSEYTARMVYVTGKIISDPGEKILIMNVATIRY